MMAESRPRDERRRKPLLLMTGCAGLLGSRIMQDLGRDHQIIGLDIAEPDLLSHDAKWIECDLTDDNDVRKTISHIRDEFGSRVASVIHLAAYYDFSGEPSPMYDQLTVQGTRRMIDSLKQFETVEQFIFSSSLLAMKPVEDDEGALTERSPTRGEWDYPQSKLEAERVLRNHHGDIPVVIHRIAGVYNEDGRSLPITQHIRRIREKELESFLFPGDPDHGQAFVHLDDLVACFRKTIDKRRELSNWEVFLIAEPDVMSHVELQNVIGELVHGKEWPTIRIPKAFAKAGAWAKDKVTGEDVFIKPWMIDLADDHYPVEIDRSRKTLGWSPRHRLRDTLPEMIRRLKDDPANWYRLNKLPLPDRLKEREVQEASRS